MKKKTILALLFTFIFLTVNAQEYSFKELQQTPIKGAPKLTQPTFVKAGDKYVQVTKYGQAAPALYDWDGDGILDLLVGEFGGGNKANVLVYKNIGTNKEPLYPSEPIYAKDSSSNHLFISGS